MLSWSELRRRLEANPAIDLQVFEVGPPLSDADLDLWEESYAVKLPPPLRALYAQGDGADVLWLARPGVDFDAGRLLLPELSGRVRLLELAEFLDDSDDDPLWRDEGDPTLRLLDFYGADFPAREGFGLRLADRRFHPEILHCGRGWGSAPLRLGGRPVDLPRYLEWTSRIAGFRGWADAGLSSPHRADFLAAVAAVFGSDAAGWAAAELSP